LFDHGRDRLVGWYAKRGTIDIPRNRKQAEKIEIRQQENSRFRPIVDLGAPKLVSV